MTCRDVADALAGYVSGELAPESRAEVDAHLASCASCAAYLEAYRGTLALAKHAFEEPEATAPDVPTELTRRILERRRKD